MLKIVKYEGSENDVHVGFKKHNFVVYGSIGKEVVQGLTKQQKLQKVYELCKEAIDYETERHNKGLSNSIISEEAGEVFIPEISRVVAIEFELPINGYTFGKTGATFEIPLHSTLKSQYNEIIVDTVEFTSNHGAIEDNVLILRPVDELTEVGITVDYGNISKTIKVMLYPYVEPIPTDEELKIQELERQLFDVQNYIVNKQYEDLLNEGGI